MVETGDRQLNRTRKGQPREVISRAYQNIPECHIRDDSGFSGLTVGRYPVGLCVMCVGNSRD